MDCEKLEKWVRAVRQTPFEVLPSPVADPPEDWTDEIEELFRKWLLAGKPGMLKMPSDFAPLDRETETRLLRYVFNRAIEATQRQYLECVESVHAACPDATARKEKAHE
jgi:hypothetical protein